MHSIAIETTQTIRSLIGKSAKDMTDGQALRAPAPILMRAGRHGGLPFDSLTTDLYLGCLPASQICYGSCFAARGAFAAGYDFGVRVENVLNGELLGSDIAHLPTNQRFLRNGWNSDPSWNWPKAYVLAKMIRDSGRCPVFVTKYFRVLDRNTLSGLLQVGSELRVSLSAMDTPGQLRQRLEGLLSYRRAGGVAVPVVMSSFFADKRLNERQEELVGWIEQHDLPGAENSLRIPSHLPVSKLLDLDRVGVLGGSGDLWAGRIYGDRLPVPTITSVPSDYPGLPWYQRSALDLDQLEVWRKDPVHTHMEVMLDRRLTQPDQCGVSQAWATPADKRSNCDEGDFSPVPRIP